MARVTARGVDNPVAQLRLLKKDLADMTDEELAEALEKNRVITEMRIKAGPSAPRERKPTALPKPKAAFDPDNVF